MDCLNRRTLHPQRRPLARRNVVNQDVGGLEKFIQLRSIRGDSEVKADTAFVRIEIMEETARVGVRVVADERAATACAVALRRLDLHHLSTQKRHQLRRKRSGNSVAAFNHTKFVKG